MSIKQSFLGAASAQQNFVDDLFAVHLYTGNGSTQTITNGIDLAGKGGMVWIKQRNGTGWNLLFDTARGAGHHLTSNGTDADSGFINNSLTAFNSNGFSLGADSSTGGMVNGNTNTEASWTFRKAPKFFDVVTYSGNSTARTISHNLGTAPGMVIIKCTNTTNNWLVWHRSTSPQTNTYSMYLNSTGAWQDQGSNTWGSMTFDSSVFSVGDGAAINVNTTGNTYVAYLFAHDTGTDGIIQAGSFTTDGSGNATVNLGWEPQWITIKRSDSTSNWQTLDTMRGWSFSADPALFPNTSGAEATGAGEGNPTATGFQYTSGLAASATYIYLAIRRPNKPPTSGTQVYEGVNVTGATGSTITTNFPIDLQMYAYRPGISANTSFVDRLRGFAKDTSGVPPYLVSSGTAAEATGNNYSYGWDNTGSLRGTFGPGIFWNFRRAPGVFDVVCYTGDGTSSQTVPHQLGVAPEMMIVKTRSATAGWAVYHTLTGTNQTPLINSSGTGYTSRGGADFPSAPTASNFYVNVSGITNTGSTTYVNYLLATKPGISFVGSYTGNGGSADSAGTSQTINCGFTAGARFVMLKCTSHTSDWVVVDTVRGLIAGNDPALSLNTTAAEVTTTDLLDPDNSGFVVNQLASGTTSANFNVTGRTYIVLAFS